MIETVLASSFAVAVGGVVAGRAASAYRHPSRLARAITTHSAFSGDGTSRVTVTG
ncbi:MAG: hypothetical protein ABI083_05600 [Lapillicoccus sp.]